MRAITLIIVHHSAGRDTETAEQVRAFHMTPPPRGRGWRDIGYHWLVRRASPGSSTWLVEQGRSELIVGAHDADQNAHSIGICLAGDYTQGPVPPEARRALVDLVVATCRRYGLDAHQVEGHRENEPASTPTACPGFDPAALREEVRDQLALLARDAA